ncbi:MAG: imidazole glycerol phosphate synthase subunit HisH [Acidobacteria bacterium]|nr:imidazole glycerol phosphate synthase subunit HisH [Acidobacteriota bacterium]
MISVIDYGAGNLRSVENALNQLEVPFAITSRAEDVARASAVLLPGVGHFGQMMRSLERLGLISALRQSIQGGVPYLGICLGMHALFEASEEAPALAGLGILKGTIRRFPEGMKVPHMGWNQLQFEEGTRFFEGIEPAPFVYFAHSYYLPAAETVSSANGTFAAAIAEYGFPFVAAIEHDNIAGVQFHPEKSGDLGLRMLRNFAQGR